MRNTLAISHGTQIFYGGDYNPEQWPKEVWHEDVRLMREAGVNMVSLGIFSWAKLEPTPGRYDFSWLDEIVNLLWQNGIAVDLATATASPPAWLVKRHPEVLPVDENGARYSHGSRQHYCPNSPEYREFSQRLVRRLAEHYRDHPALAMWHVNNEYGCHVSRCYCPRCEAAFRNWLKARYGTLDELNDRWGTAFWSQTYSDWDEVPLPGKTPTFANPGQQLDYARFMSDSLINLFVAERDILKEVTPDVPVMTNLMGFFKPIDYFKLASHMDLVTWDSYPEPTAGVPLLAAMSHDLMRSLKQGQPFVLMEQTTSQVNWRPQNPLKRPGVMRLWSYQTVAHGGDGVMFFQWRASRAGAEKFHGAMVPHAGANTRVFREVTELGQELRALSAVVDSRVEAEVAILFDWANWWALELDSKPSRDIRYLDELLRWYRPLFEHNIAVDFIQPEGDLSRYKLVLAPNLYMLTERAAENIRRYVRQGGVFITTFFSGIVDENDRVHLGGYPAPLRDVLGMYVEEFDPFLPGQTVPCRWTGASLARASLKASAALTGSAQGAAPRSPASLATPVLPAEFTADLWADVIHLEGAVPLATYGADFYAGQPAVTAHAFDEGLAVYVGTRPSESALAQLVTALAETAGVRPALTAPAGIEAVWRKQANGAAFLFVLNHRAEEQKVDLSPIGNGLVDVLSGETVNTCLDLPAYGVRVLRREG